MTQPTATLISIEPSPNNIIHDLHRIREVIADSYGGDLHALTADLQRQSEESGQPIWRASSPGKRIPTPSETNASLALPTSDPLQVAG